MRCNRVQRPTLAKSKLYAKTGPTTNVELRFIDVPEYDLYMLKPKAQSPKPRAQKAC